MNRRSLLLCTPALFLSRNTGAASSSILWNQPNVAPYTGGARLALEKMRNLMPERVETAFLRKIEARQEGVRDRLVPGLQLAAMMSGADRLLPNVVVGDWPITRSDLSPYAMKYHVRNGDTDYYFLVPEVCNNCSLLVLLNGVCIPNPTACSRDCAEYARQFVS